LEPDPHLGVVHYLDVQLGSLLPEALLNLEIARLLRLRVVMMAIAAMIAVSS